MLNLGKGSLRFVIRGVVSKLLQRCFLGAALVSNLLLLLIPQRACSLV